LSTRGRPRKNPPPPLAPDRAAWAQQPDEPDEAHAAFLAMRDHELPRPPIKVVHAAAGNGAPLSTWRAWSSKHQWAARVKAWDLRVAEPVEAAVVAEIVREPVAQASAIAKRQLQHAAKLHALATRELDKLLRLSANSDEIVITPKTLMALIMLALQLERALVPEPGADGSTPDALDLGRLDTEDLYRLQRMARKLSEST